LDAGLTIFFCKNIIFVKSKEVKTRRNPEDSSKEGCGSKGDDDDDDDDGRKRQITKKNRQA
jgi:hypothetical protein